MFAKSVTRNVFLGLILGIVVAPASQGAAVEQLFYGPWQIPRTGAVTQVQASIEVPATLTAPYRLHVQNGDGAGSHRILSATVALNGTAVVFPWDFYDINLQPPGVGVQTVLSLDRTVSLQTRNTLRVRFLGVPGSYLVVSVYGTVPPPTLRGLDPPSLPILSGATGTLVAAINAAQPADTPIAFSSSDPTVAAVPASVTVPAGQVAASVPVVAGVPGTATVTAALNGSRRQSTITVTPAGPTLTSLLPATLQVSQGATGTLTVTLTPAQVTDTVVPLNTADPTVAAVPATVTVPAGAVTALVPVAGLAPGTATITAGPLNGTSVQSQTTVVLPPPTVVSLAPPVLPLTEGSTGTLALTLNASQPVETEVTLTTSDPAIVGLPGDRVVVPAHSPTIPFTIAGLTRGTATVTVTLNGTSATSAVTVQPPLPTVSAFACPVTLTVDVAGQCTLMLNATQLTDTLVPLAGSAPAVLNVPASVTVPAGQSTAPVPVVALTPGTAVVTAGPLNETSKQATVQVLPPPPTLVSLTPSPATLLVGASTTLSLTLNAAQPTDTGVALATAPAGVLTVPDTVMVPAGTVSVPVPITGVLPGSASLTAGPLNGTTVEVTVIVTQLPPTVTSVTPPDLTLPKGTAESLTVTITPVQADPTTVPLTSSDPATVEVPASVPVPAGSATAAFPVIGRSVGPATVTAGPLNDTTTTATVTVTPPVLVTLTIVPTAVTLAVGQTQALTATGTYTDGTTQDLSATAAWASSDDAIATVSSPGGVTAARAVGQATIKVTADGKSATVTVTVTPPVITVLALTPTSPLRAVGQAVQFQATGTYTDGTTQDLTGTITWTSSVPAVATITTPGGLASALAVGETTITATHADGLSASTSLTVTAPALLSLTITPANPSVTAGQLLQLAAVGTFTDGTTQNMTTQVAWTSAAPLVASVSPTGLVTGLTAGTAALTATTATGISAGTTVTIVVPPPTLTITSPADGATLTADRVLVQGTVTAATAEVGVGVNGVPAQVNGGQWTVEVPLQLGPNVLTATAITPHGGQTTVTRTVTGAAGPTPALRVQALPESGVTPHTVRWQVTNSTGRPLVQYELDPQGTGSFGAPRTTLEGVQTTYTVPGLVFPVLRATDDRGAVYTATTLVNVLPRSELDALLRQKWESLRAAFTAQAIETAVGFFVAGRQAGYRALFTALADQLPQFAQEMAGIQLIYVLEGQAKYRLRRTELYGGQAVTFTYYAYFVQDATGAWRLEGF